MRNIRFKSTAGFTLMEILVVMSVITAIAVIATVPFLEFRRRTVLRSQTESVASIVTQARHNTLSSQEKDTYGVQFESDRVVLFRGSTFDDTDPDNIETEIDPLLEIFDISLEGGGSHVLFERLTGETPHSGVVRLRLIADHSASTTITVFSSGLVTSSE